MVENMSVAPCLYSWHFKFSFNWPNSNRGFICLIYSFRENIMSLYIDCKMTTHRTTVRRIFCTTFRRGVLSIAPEVVKAGFVA